MRCITRREFARLGVSAVALTLLAGCSPSGGGPVSSRSASSSSYGQSAAVAAAESGGLSFVTGGQRGAYFEFGEKLASHAAKSAGLDLTVLVSDGSVANLEELDSGGAVFGFCQSDVVARAFNGENPFEGAPMKSFSAVALLYDEYVQIVARGHDIRSVADLKGKRVSLGVPKSGVYVTSTDILAAYGMTDEDIIPTYQGLGDSVNSLAAGEIDAAFFVAGAPTAAIVDLFKSKDVSLVPLDRRHVSGLIDASRSRAKATIAAGTYPGQDVGVPTMAIGAVLLAANTASSEDVYAFAQDVFASAADEVTASTYGRYAEISVAKGASIVSVPYHPGAARFFEEQGFHVETA